MEKVAVANVQYHVFLSAYWAACALLACIVFACYIWRDRPWIAMFMRYQLAFGLACVAFGDAWAGAIGTLFWYGARYGVMDVQQYMIYVLIPIRALQCLGFTVAIRAVTFDKYENKVWITWMIMTMAIGIILTKVFL